jgi:hypothetical protein
MNWGTFCVEEGLQWMGKERDKKDNGVVNMNKLHYNDICA